jgi:N-acetylglutamate synthase-like GNAT family acetyltransferase
MSPPEPELLLVRRADGRAAEAYVLMEVGAPDGPLARCVVARTAPDAAAVRELAVAPGPAGCEHARRLLADVADLLRADGVRRFRGAHHDGTPFDHRL